MATEAEVEAAEYPWTIAGTRKLLADNRRYLEAWLKGARAAAERVRANANQTGGDGE